MVAPAAPRTAGLRQVPGWMVLGQRDPLLGLDPGHWKGADFLLVLSREWMGTREWGYY